jgi:hypothetical protein
MPALQFHHFRQRGKIKDTLDVFADWAEQFGHVCLQPLPAVPNRQVLLFRNAISGHISSFLKNLFTLGNGNQGRVPNFFLLIARGWVGLGHRMRAFPIGFGGFGVHVISRDNLNRFPKQSLPTGISLLGPRGWILPPHTGWGLHLTNGSVVPLGVPSPESGAYDKLFIAKFLDGSYVNNWHGYPADPAGHQQDIPPESVLQSWLGAKLLRPAIIRKVIQGKRCNL